MSETGPPDADLSARLAEAERRLAVYDRFQKETLAVLSKAMATAQEIRAKAEADAKQLLDRARLEAPLIDEAVARLRLDYPDLAQRLRALREAAGTTPLPSGEDELRAEVESLRKRLEIYEGFEDTIQSVLTEALRAAHGIRTRSEEEASQGAERARAEGRGLQDELGRLRAERDALSAVVEELRRARDTMAAQRAEAETTSGTLASDLERLRASVAAEASALEERRKERETLEREVAALRDEVGRLGAARTAASAARGVAPTVQEELRRELAEDIERLRAERAAMARERDYQSEEVTRVRAERDAVAQQLVGLREAFAAALHQVVRTVAQPPLGAPVLAEAPAVRPEAPPPPAPAPEAAAAAQLTEQSEVRVLVSPIASFSGLVDLERRLQGFAGIRSVYVRDFRAGVATLSCNVAKAMSMQDLADMLARELDATIERVAEGVIELKAKAEDAKAGARATAG